VLAPLLRAAPWRALLGLTTAGACVGAAGVAIGTGTGMRVLQLGLVLVGAASACALDETAAAVVSACPVRRSAQVLVRALAAAPGLLVGAVLVAAWASAESLDRLLLVELAGTWLLALALAAVARHHLDEPSEVVISGLVLTLVTVILWPPIGRRLVLFPIGELGERAVRTWAAIAAGSAVALVLAVRERRWNR